MLLSFPHMGQLYKAITETCRRLGIPYLVPSPPGPQALQLGQDLAPEGSCLPFSLVLGNMREALNLGADTLLMLGGSGPCRFGYFAYLAERVLVDAGYSFTLLKVDRGYNWQTLTTLKKAAGVSWPRLLQALQHGWQVMACEETLARIEREHVPLAANPAPLKAQLQHCMEQLSQARNIGEVLKIEEIAWSGIVETAPRDRAEVIKIGLVGDIYTLLEPYANQSVEEFLLNRGNVCIYKDMAISSWIPNVTLPWRKHNYKKELLLKAYPYLSDSVGGFGLESVATSCALQQRDIDGIIQLFPLGCMPEIVARSALHKLGKEEGIPIMSITMDQHDSITGFQTRIEAFLDLVESKKRQRSKRKGA